MKNTLYELTGLFRELYEAETGEDGISEESWFDTLESLECELNEKAENVAVVFKQFLADADAMKAEELHLKERRKVIENKADRLKSYLLSMLTAAGKDKIEGTKAKISITKGRESVEIEGVEGLKKIEQVWKPYVYDIDHVSKTVVKELLESGAEIEGVQITRRPGITIK